jgi:hypothetical protein
VAWRAVASGALRADDFAKRRPLAERFSAAVVQSSAPRMRANDVQPGDEIELVDLNPRWSRVLFRLPAETPRMACQVPGGARVELEPKIRSVFVEPDSSRVSVCWVGEARVVRSESG